MEIIRPGTNYDFLGKRKIWFGVSLAVILLGLASLVVRGGPRYGIDFAGGTLIQVQFHKPVKAGEIRSALADVIQGQVVVQSFGEEDEYIIQTEQSSGELEGLAKQVHDALAQKLGDDTVEIRRVEMVGPKVGKDLREKGLLAVLFSLGAILLYIWWRFELRFGFGAVAALFHDVLITIGAFSLFNKQFDLTTVAALLTIVGYSLNDTIVVFDRIRENIKRAGGKGDLEALMNRSVNETLSRTLLTSLTTLLVVVALFVFGGGVIHDFAFALLVGIVVGTYSSIYIASPVVLALEKRAGGARAVESRA
ncbi:MAG: protein translocase subunit SecF [Candidatus Dadabacteria bacterium]|nr:MAG: protein translocase subunit SecF [Candidatus Dadabacteria bacterium]